MSEEPTFIVSCRDPVGSSVTDVHENTHQLHSELRNKYGNKYNAMYKGNGQAFILLEPKTTLSAIAAIIPKPLQGMSYRLYLIQQQQWWNNQPLYLGDELCAYLAGSRHPQSETSDYLQACEFLFYNYYLLTILPYDYIDYNNYKQALMWATEEVHKYKDNPRVAEHINKFRQFKDLIRPQFMAEWFDGFYGN